MLALSLLESPQTNFSQDASPGNGSDTPLSKLQLADRELLKTFNILPAHFVRRNSGLVTDDYEFLSPPIGRGD